jgi:hypothetical protein
MEQLRERIRTQSTEMILECLTAIGGGQVDVDRRMVRAAAPVKKKAMRLWTYSDCNSRNTCSPQVSVAQSYTDEA